MPLALELTNKLLEIVPAHQRALGNKQYYESTMQTTPANYQRKGDDETTQIIDETMAVKEEVFKIFVLILSSNFIM